MADVITTVYDFTLPEVGASDDTWGTKLNANFSKLETLFDNFFDGGSPSSLGKIKSPATVQGTTTTVLNFIESEQVAPAGRYRFVGDTGNFVLQRALTGEFVTNESILNVRGSADPKTLDVSSAYLFRALGGIVIDNTIDGLSFSSTLASDPVDLTHHVLLHENGYGFSISTSRLNHVVGSASGAHDFYTGVGLRASIGFDAGGIAETYLRLYGDLTLPSHGAINFGDATNRVKYVGPGFHFIGAEGTVARVDAGGTALPASTTILTKEKGDARYALKTALRDALNSLSSPTPEQLRIALLNAIQGD